jgi:hypothetical protein
MALLLRQQTLKGALPRELLAACTLSLNSRHFSVLNRPPPNYPGHVPLTRIEKAGLAVGSAVMSLMDPYRGGIYSSNILSFGSVEDRADERCRFDSSSWRSYCNAVLHLPSPGRNAL